MWYSYFDEPHKFIELDLSRVLEIIAINNKGNTPAELIDLENLVVETVEPDYANVVGQDDLTRFDRQKQQNRKKKKKKKRNPNQTANNSKVEASNNTNDTSTKPKKKKKPFRPKNKPNKPQE